MQKFVKLPTLRASVSINPVYVTYVEPAVLDNGVSYVGVLGKDTPLVISLSSAEVLNILASYKSA